MDKATIAADATAVAVAAFVAVMVISVSGLIVTRFIKPNGGKPRGVGVRFIQALAVAILVPGVFLLALLKAIDIQAMQVLLGATAGYLLSGLSEWQGASNKDEPRPDDRDS